MQSKRQFLVCLSDLYQKKGVLLVFESVFASFEELNGVFDVLELAGASDRDEGVLDRVESVVKMTHKGFVELHQFSPFSSTVE